MAGFSAKSLKNKNKASQTHITEKKESWIGEYILQKFN